MATPKIVTTFRSLLYLLLLVVASLHSGDAFFTAGLAARPAKVVTMAWKRSIPPASIMPSKTTASPLRSWRKAVAPLEGTHQADDRMVVVKPEVRHESRNPWDRKVRSRVVALLLSAAVVGATGLRAWASGTAEGEKLHLGQKVANYIRTATGWPDWLILMVISGLPVVELRGGVPVGLWMGIPPLQTFVLACVGNFIPVPFILLVLNSSQWLREKVQPVLEKKLKDVTGSTLTWQSLAIFVGVPLPGTGAWTGAAAGALFKMSYKETVFGTVLGIVSAAMIMTAVVLAGTTGGVAVAVALLLSLIGQQLASRRGNHEV